MSSIFVTHLDLLDDLPEIQICSSYNSNSPMYSGELNQIKGRMPATIYELGDWNAIYEKIPGWRKNT